MSFTTHVDGYLYSTVLPYNKEAMVADCLELERYLKNRFKGDASAPMSFDYGCFTAEVHRKYNFFSVHTKEINTFTNNFRDIVKPFLPKNNYLIQCWINLFRKGKFIDWHSHWEPRFQAYHGYFCVDVGESITSYRWTNGRTYDVHNRDGMLIIGKSLNDSHKSPLWMEERPRITIAFDVLPVTTFNAIRSTIGMQEIHYDEHLTAL